jgi:hypothetical protein
MAFPVSPAHAAAAARNGAHSQGPVTAEGKSRSSQNARKFNIFTAIELLPHEDREELETLAAEFEDEYNPQTPTERLYLREMIDAEWRLRRTRQAACILQARQMEALPAGMNPHAAAAEAFRQLADTSKSLELLRRYEAQFRRQFDKSLQLLLDVRRRRQLDRETLARQADLAMCAALEASILAPLPGEPGYPEDSPQPSQTPNCKNEPKPPASAGPFDALLGPMRGLDKLRRMP